MKIILVDDDNDYRLVFAMALSKLDLRVELFYVQSSAEMFTTLEEEPDIKLIVLDLGLPGKDGRQTLKELKRHDKFNHIPVVIYTVSNSLADISDTFDAGAHYYVVKPYVPVNFVQAVGKVFSVDWTKQQPKPPREDYVIDLAFM